MFNIGESPSVVVESSLSQILEDNAQEKYYLSPKACVGILHRAEHRGKDLPTRLKAALENQAGIQKDTLTAMDRPAVAYGLQENQRDEMRMVREKSPCLSTSGGRCGQGLPATMVEEDTSVLCVDQGG